MMRAPYLKFICSKRFLLAVCLGVAVSGMGLSAARGKGPAGAARPMDRPHDANDPRFYGQNGAGNPNNQPKNDSSTTQPSADMPEIDTQAVDVAQGTVTRTHEELARAQKALLTVTKKLSGDLVTHADFTQATAKVNSAKAAYTAAVGPVLAALKSRDDYQAAQATVDQAQQQVNSQQESPDTSGADRIAAGQQLINAKNAVSKIQNDAVAADSNAATAKGNWDAATAAIAALRRQFDDSVKQDPQYVSAKQAVDDARAKVTEADQALAAAKQDLAKQKQARAAAYNAQAKSNQANGAPPKPAN